ncbi:MAG: amidohydrolase family protein [Gammaproteobacteria bacterium]|nr:amidohydrolase family protein [Gammaproteobacteria bacterium]
MLIRGAEIMGSDASCLRIRDGQIQEIAAQLSPAVSERCIDAGGGALLPGLHDHHIHLMATAAAMRSLDCGPSSVIDEAGLRGALQACPGGETDWIRGVGFHDSVGAEIDRNWLDRVCPGRPVRIQHRSGMLWILNSEALDRLGIADGDELPPGAEREPSGRLNGLFYDLDAWLGTRQHRSAPGFRALGERLSACGVTGVTDAGPRNGEAEWRLLGKARVEGELPQRVVVMGSESLDALVSEGDTGLFVGPLKIYLRETDMPDFDEVVARVRGAHRHTRAAAFHCVTRAELVFAIAVLDVAGSESGDRIEHASICDDAMLAEIRRLSLTVVTQPHFIRERGDQYLREVPLADQDLLYRGAGFLRAGCALAAGTDAPYGDPDPWAAMRSAVNRRTAKGTQLMASEVLTPEQALAMFCCHPMRPGSGLHTLCEGAPADLCLLDAPWSVVREDLHRRHVVATLINGQVHYEAGPR